MDCSHCRHCTEFDIENNLTCLPAAQASGLGELFGVDTGASKDPITSGDIAELFQREADANMIDNNDEDDDDGRPEGVVSGKAAS